MNDVSDRSGRAAMFPAKVKLPPLSPGFLTEEDAAYWVHTRVPLDSDREYESAILLRPDGRFVATLPIAGEATSFDFGAIIATDALGAMLHPPGYRCIANVHSHPALHGQVRNAHLRQDEMLVRLFIGFYSQGDFIGDVATRDFFRSAYLSGPDGTLLKYVPSRSPEERDFYLRLQSRAPSPAFDVVGLIHTLATVGELKVIVSNADWGHSVGRVPKDWTPGERFSTGAPSELPLMTRVCVNAERAVLAALKSRGAQTAGLLLKKLSGEEYVATHARPAGLAAWDPEGLFPVDAQGQLQLPRGYLLEGFYFASRPDPAQFPPAQPWLSENFFSAHEIALAIEANARSQHLAQVGRALALYMLTKDQAMLKYTFSNEPIEAALSVVRADGTVSDNGVHDRLLAGTLSPQAFVSMLVLAGRLHVVRGSALWAHLGPVDLQWRPFARFPWPVLSGDFLCADDAARHAHDLLGLRRDRQFVGYVFQRSDQRFVVSEPLPGDIDTLSEGRLYPMDNRGRPVFPDDHAVHARYVSHVALSRLEPVNVEYSRLTGEEALLSVQMLNVDEVRQALLDGVIVYCSGANDSLLRFQASKSLIAQDLGRRLGTRRHPGALARELDNGTRRPQELVRELLAAGELVSLIDTQLWRHRGPLRNDWTLQVLTRPASSTATPEVPMLPEPFPAATTTVTTASPATSTALPWKRPAFVAYGAIFGSADEAAQSQHARDTRLDDDNRAWFGFILKHKSAETFVATELLPVNDRRDNLFRLDSVFEARLSEPWHQYPEGFELYASFYSHQRVKQPDQTPLAWLAHYFMTPDDLTVAMYYSPRRPVIASGLPAALYVATRDGALLKYVPDKSGKLFHEQARAATLATFHGDLVNGKWLPSDFIHAVADSGELSVMRTSVCWDRSGRVRVTWQPYAHLQRRWLGPACQTADDAAVHARALLPPMTDKTFGGLILRRADGLFVATTPIEVSREDFAATEIFPDESRRGGLFPADCRIVARYRSRVPRELSVVLSAVQKRIYLNMLSVDTVYSALTRLPQDKWDEYLFAPDGALIRYQPGVWERLRSDLLAVLTDYKSVPAALDAIAIRRRLRSGDLKPVDWIDSLARSGYLQVVTGSELWGVPRQVERWVPFSADLQPVTDYTPASAAPSCSPVFVQPDGAARYVHEMSLSRDTQAFGFILRSPDSLFLATLPLAVQRSALALERVFEQGRLASGYTLEGIYLRAALPPVEAGLDDVRLVFVLPGDVQQACLRASTAQGYQPVYVSCADGALLKLQLHAFEPGTFYDRFGQIELRPNTFVSPEQAAVDERAIARGTFSLAGYVQRMAVAGQLDVLRTSAHWSRHGRVSDSWEPHQADLSAEQRWREHPVPALGPVFHHPDDAARYAHKRVAATVDIDIGYEGAIVAHAASARWVPLEPIAYFANEDNPLFRILRTAEDPTANWHNPAPRYPEGYTLVASHQFHFSGNTLLGADIDQVHANFAAPALVRAHTHEAVEKGLPVQDYYYSTPYDVLLKYSPVYSRAERELLSTRAVTFEGGKWVSRLSPGEFLSRLMQLGNFSVLIAGHYWRQSGRMGGPWRIHRQQAPAPGTVRRRDEL